MFKLNIECSKDISELHINFTDGTCSTVGTPNIPKKQKEFNEIKEIKEKPKKEKSVLKAEEFIDSEDISDWGDYSTPVVSEKVELPKIEIPERAVKVDSNLQNLEI